MDASKVLVVVPCKIDSKRLPGKNFRTVKGKPLVQWACEVALRALPGARVRVVFHDDDSVLENFPGVPDLWDFVASLENKEDIACLNTQDWFPRENAALVALWATMKMDEAPEAVVLLQPSTLRHPELVKEAIAYLNAGHSAVVSVSPVAHLVGTGSVSQYNGGVYAWRTSWLLGGALKLLAGATLLHGAHRLGAKGKVIDIDTIGDLAKAEAEWED